MGRKIFIRGLSGLVLVVWTAAGWAAEDTADDALRESSKSFSVSVEKDDASQPAAPVAAETPAEPVSTETSSTETSTDLISAEATGNIEKVTLDYRDTELSTILRALSYTYSLNLVTSGDVKGKITISLKDVSLDEALEAILSSQGLVYSRKGRVVYINPGTTDAASIDSEPVFLKYIKAADAQNLLRKVLSQKGDMKVDESSNSILITDYSANVKRVKDLLKKIDIAPTQVLIEAKLVDITTKDFSNLGVTWSAQYRPAGAQKGLFGHSTLAQEELSGGLTLPGGSSALSGGQITLDTLTLKNININATIDALISDQKAHLIASPSIAVLNNQEARIVIGEKVPYKERSQTATGTTETTQFIDVGTTLRVTPTINEDGYITMRIHPEVSSVSALLDAGPRITTREADTTVRIKEGETVVIAGLIKQDYNRSKSGLPVLGQIPGLEYAFGNRNHENTQTELAVFITPQILRSRGEMEIFEKVSGVEAAKREQNITLAPETGKLNEVNALFDKANHLERGTGLESGEKPAWFRMRQALNIYNHLIQEFPDSPQVPEALWRIARIQSSFYKDNSAASGTLKKLLEKYPGSARAPEAQRLLQRLEMPLAGTASTR